MNRLSLLLLSFLLVINLAGFAQSPSAIETDLLKSFKKIDPKNADNEKSTDDFAKKLKTYAEAHPSTISQEFGSLKSAGLNVAASTDGLFRIYSWDTWTGGTMHFFENVFQYKSGVVTKAIIDTPKGEGDNRPNYQKVYTFKAKGETYYLCTYMTIGSTKDVGQGIQVFAIEDGRLNQDVKLIKTKSGLHSQLNLNFDFFSEVDWKVRPEIYFDPDLDTINLPLIDSDGKMTHKYIVYKFTGQYFERVKN